MRESEHSMPSPSQTSQGRERHPGIDALKIIAMFMVVFYHACYYKLNYGFEEGSNVYIPNLTRCLMNLCSVSVPLFFMCSGYCTLPSSSSSWRKMIKKVIMIAVLTLFWNYVCPFPTWFFFSLAALYLVTPLLRYVRSRHHILYWLGISLIFLATFATNEAYVLSRLWSPNFLDGYEIQGLFTSYALVYYALGGAFREKRLPLPTAIILFILGYTLSLIDTSILSTANGKVFDGVNAAFPMMSSLMMSCGIFAVFMRLRDVNPKLRNILALVGGGCLSVYILHSCVTKYIVRSMAWLGIESFNYPITMSLGLILTCIVMAISLLIGFTIRKIPYISLLLKL